MNWLFARHSGGHFILRVEDTDLERSTRESERAILEDLKWLGLTWDEGPDAGGDFGPYRQSERGDAYRETVDTLIRAGRAYPCFCTPEELEERRKASLARGESAHYDGRCRNLSPEEREKRIAGGERPAIRFRVESQEVVFQDLVKGEIRFETDNIADFILSRPDGMPMYNFACVVDDHGMAVTHVIRGDDHVSNTPRQLLLYQALNWETPVFAHIPMILGSDRERLSKRHGATSVSQYREAGYLPEALVNYLSLLSWSSESGDEILSEERLVREFDFDRVSRSAAVFDSVKLDWMNGMYIRGMDVDQLAERARPFLEAAGYSPLSGPRFRAVIGLIQDKMERLSEVGEKAGVFYQEEAVPENAEAEAVLEAPETKIVAKAFIESMDLEREWTGEAFQRVMKKIQESTGVRGKKLWMPVRVVLTGRVHGPDLAGTAGILGREKCRRMMEMVLVKGG
jgi:glutamyl-tRNA synthetase